MRGVALLLVLSGCSASVAGDYRGTLQGEERCEGSTQQVSVPASLKVDFIGTTLFESTVQLAVFGKPASCSEPAMVLDDALHSEFTGLSNCGDGQLELTSGSLDFVRGGVATRLLFSRSRSDGSGAVVCDGTYTGFLTR